MFAALFTRAQAAVDTAIGQLVNRAIIAVPFIIAGGFATAALYMRLDRSYGAETATLFMAGIFAAFGLLTLALFGRKSSQLPPAADNAAASTSDSVDTEATSAPISGADKELLFAALASAAPIALPGLMRLALRNIPIILAILAALFVMTRQEPEAAAATAEGDQ